MSQIIEDYLPPVQSAGLNTQENASIGGTLTVSGQSTFSGGYVNNVVNQTASGTLTVAQSGSTVLYNSTTGIVMTLPAPAAGLTYTFVVAQTPAAASHGIITNSASVFLLGGVEVNSSTGATLYFAGNGSTHIALRMNGSTTGGTMGTYITATAISSTQWMVTGTLNGSGALVTPFNTV